MEDHGGQLFEESMRFIYEKEDLVTLRPGRAAAWLVFRVGDILRRSKVFNVGANPLILDEYSY